MSDFWIYGDVHNHVGTAQAFLESAKPSKVIWLGDFNDSFGDSPYHSMQTGAWLKKTIDERPDDIFILSNHDISYRFSLNDRYKGYGWTANKCRAFHSHFPLRYWKKFQIFHTEDYKGQTILSSHAGFLKEKCPLGRFDLKSFKDSEEIDLRLAYKTDYQSPWLHSNYGPLWWRWPLPVLDGVCQVVGHTPQDEPAIVTQMPLIGREKVCWNLNMDCAHTYAVHFSEEGIFSYNHKNGNKKLLEF